MADITAAYFGAKRQGKSTQVKHLLMVRARPRRLILDPMDEYHGHADRLTSLVELRARVRDSAQFSLRYVIPFSDKKKETDARFSGFCTVAYEAGQLDMVADELQRFTTASWAPASWYECVLRGGHRGISVIGCSQRPADICKSFRGNLDTVSTCRLVDEDDIDVLRKLLGCDRERVLRLRQYDFLTRALDDDACTAGNTGPLLKALKARGLDPARKRPKQK